MTIEDEINFVKAYLELQKYRFGDRLCYEISDPSECGQYRLPRLTLVTFVENACVHGTEKKEAACWVFVRVSQDGDNLVLEVDQRVEQKVWVYLAVQRQQFGPLSGDILFLAFQSVLILVLDQIVHPPRHLIIRGLMRPCARICHCSAF